MNCIEYYKLWLNFLVLFVSFVMYLPASAQLMFGRLYRQAATGDGITLVNGDHRHATGVYLHRQSE
jgi:hypothetical protein